MPIFRLKSLSLGRLSLAAIAAFTLSAVLVVGALLTVSASANDAVRDWRRYADLVSVEQRLLRGFVTQAGMGGVVDDYAQLVLADQEDEGAGRRIYAHAGAALAAIGAYPDASASAEVQQAKRDLQATIRRYLAQSEKLAKLRRAGATPETIRAAGLIDTPAASNALDVLARDVAGRTSSSSGSDPKAIILLDMRRALGLAGLVDYANQYAMGGDEAARVKAKAALAAAKAAMARYDRHPKSEGEIAAIGRIQSALSALDTLLDEGRGSLASLHDRTTSVQQALQQLEVAAYGDAVVAHNNLQQTLTSVAQRANIIIYVVIGGALLLVAGSVWLLIFRTARRINSLTATMRALASGRLDTEIPAANDRDEVGEMSRALIIFRDGLRANQVLTHELADSSRLASLGAMVAGIAHELNTPLGNALAVSTSLEEEGRLLQMHVSGAQVRRSVVGDHTSSIVEASDLIRRNLERAAEQINGFKQLAADQASGQRRVFELEGVLKNVVDTMATRFRRTGHQLTMSPGGSVIMDSYPGALAQVLSNLVENALKHGLAGTTGGAVTLSAEATPTHVQLVVADTGVGIPADVMPRIFSAFFTTKAGQGGTGLGLHIVNSIVRDTLGGEIRAESTGEGARFILSLPLAAPAALAATPSLPKAKEHASPTRSAA